MSEVERELFIVESTNPAARPGRTIIRIEELDNDESALQPEAWYNVHFQLDDISSMAGRMGNFDFMGTTARIEWKVAGSVSATLLSAPSDLVDGRNVVRLSRKQDPDLTTLQLRLGWPVGLGHLVRACVGAQNRVARNPFGRDRIMVAAPFAGAVLGLSHSGVAWPRPGSGASADPDNPGPKPVSDRYLGAEVLDSEVARVSEAHVPTKSHGWIESTVCQSTRSLSDDFFDPRLLNPIGVKGNPTNGVVRTIWDPASTTLRFISDGKVIATSSGNNLQLQAVQALRSFRHVDDSPIAHPGPRNRAQFLMQAAAAGLPVATSDLDSATLRLLSPSILALYQERIGSEFDDREEREQAIARGVRAAHHDRRSAMSRMGWADVRPNVSVVMSTMRPEFLPHALDQLEAQTGVVLESLIGLHGFSAEDIPADVRHRVNRLGARLFAFPQTAVFGDVLETLSDAASGTFIAKMDDDDWYGEYHLLDLIDAADYSGGTIVGSGVQYVYMNHSSITLRRSIDQAYRYGGHPGGPTIMIRRSDLFDVGGWPRVSRAVDTGLNQRVVESGGTVYQAGPQNFLFNRRSSGHTWKASNEYFYRLARMSWSGLQPPLGFGAERAEIMRSAITRTPMRLDAAVSQTERWTREESERKRMLER